jgi:hypothetical protein
MGLYWTLSVGFLILTASIAMADDPDIASKRYQLHCPDRELTSDQLRDLVQNARESRTDLPPPPKEYEVKIRRDGCLYRYVETDLKAPRRTNNRFLMDPYGDIYNVTSTCLGSGLSDADVMAAVADARSARSDLPETPSSFATEIEKTDCHYIYREIPKLDSEPVVSITVGPHGDVLEARKDGILWN